LGIIATNPNQDNASAGSLKAKTANYFDQYKKAYAAFVDENTGSDLVSTSFLAQQKLGISIRTFYIWLIITCHIY
jgi:hypothetical protein